MTGPLPASLELQAYNDGAAFRFVVPGGEYGSILESAVTNYSEMVLLSDGAGGFRSDWRTSRRRAGPSRFGIRKTT